MGTMMLVRLYRNAVLCVIAAVIVLWVFGSVMPGRMAGSALLGPLAGYMAEFSHWVSLALLIVGVLIAALQSFALWRWHNGKGTFCHNCGGMVEERTKRHKIYDHCLACGHKQSIGH